MKTYRSHEVVNAVKCDSVKKIKVTGNGRRFTLEANDGVHYEVPAYFFKDGEPQLPFYIVKHAGGYITWQPASEFERWHTEASFENDEDEDDDEDYAEFSQGQCDECLRKECLHLSRSDADYHTRIQEAKEFYDFIKGTSE